MTASSGSVFTAAQFNSSVRDNLNAGNVVTQSGQVVVSTGANAVTARQPASAAFARSETTASASFTDLATPGPALTAVTGGQAIVIISAQIDNTSSSAAGSASYAVSGATTVAASNAVRIARDGLNANNPARFSSVSMQAALNAGSNTFTMKYVAGSGLAKFSMREITVFPL